MAGLITVTEPEREPVTAIEAREHLRLDDDVDNVQVMSYIMAARQWAENYTDRVFITRTMRQYLDAQEGIMIRYWEGSRTGHQNIGANQHIELAAAPLVEVTSIKYYNDADEESTWDASNYYVDSASDVPKVILRDGGNFPTDLRVANGLEINFTAGYGSSPKDVPEPIRLAILQYMTFMYEHRGDFERFPPPQPPVILRTLLNPYKRMRFGISAFSKMRRTGIS